MNKREFIAAGVVFACTSATPSLYDAGLAAVGTAAPGTKGRLPRFAAAPDLSAWLAYVGERFEIRGSGGRLVAHLEEVRIVHRDDRTEQFTLLFAPASDAPFPQGLHELRHANGEQIVLHLEETGPAARPRCAAHFGRLV